MSVTNGNIDLVWLLAFLSIKNTIIKSITKISKGEVDYKLLLSNCLLNKKVYFLFTLVFKKQYQRFNNFSIVEKLFKNIMRFHINYEVFIIQLI